MMAVFSFSYSYRHVHTSESLYYSGLYTADPHNIIAHENGFTFMIYAQPQTGECSC